MLAVILKILSVIGIVLLCLVGLILVLLLLVLILPVKYRLNASKEKETELIAVFKLTYFFRILRAFAVYEKKKVTVSVKILWFKLFSMEFPQKDDEDEMSYEEFDEMLEEELSDDDFEITSDDSSTVSSSVSDEELHNDLFGDDEDESGTEEESVNSGGSVDMNGTGEEAVHSDTYDDEDDEPDGLSGKVSALISKIKCKISAIYDKIKKVRSELRYYRNILNSNEASYALRVIRKRIKKIFKLILPRKVRCDLIYGFSSPDITGKVYGLYCLIRNRFTKGSRVCPDFEKAVFEGYIEAKGHFNLISLLYQAVCIILDRNCRKIYRSLRHHKNKDSESGANTEADKSEEAA